MRTVIPANIDQCRIEHPMGGGHGFDGVFVFRDRNLTVISSTGPTEEWEHVSVSRFDKQCPTWEQMCWVKKNFFLPEEWVVQYHAADQDHIDYGRNVLHLWRHKAAEFPKPPQWMV
jgi:hypothetical protein